MAWVYAYYVLAVGQGTGTLVQVCDGELKKPVWSVIIDLGSEGWSEEVALPSAKFAAEKLKNGEKSGEVTLDAVILSHSDSDHINLIPKLLKEFSDPRNPKPTKPKLSVTEVWFGGDRSKYKKGDRANVLDELHNFRPVRKPDDSNIKGLKNNVSSLDKTAPDPLVDSGKDGKIWLMIGNTIADQVSIEKNKPTRTASGGYATNTKSLVVGVSFGASPDTKEIFATGDATGLTIAKCREVLKASGETIAPSLSVSLPHHGSGTTTYDLLGLRGKEPTSELARETIEEFAKEIGAVTVSASAGERSTFRHPAIGVIEDFGGYVEEGKYKDPAVEKDGEHFYTAHMPSTHFTYDRKVKAVKSMPAKWPSKSGWYSARTAKNAFTTDYFIDLKEPVPTAWNLKAIYREESKFKPPPPRTISWVFIVENGGKAWKVEKPVDTLGLTEEQIRWVEAAIGGPLPPERFVHIPSADARD
jgi:hypothetical protein